MNRHSQTRASANDVLLPRLTKSLLSLAIAAALGAPFQAVIAQEPTGENEAGMLEEVIVTATRREESLMDIPISVTAFDGEQLNRVAANNILYVAEVTPNVTLETTRSTNNTLTAFIRGVGQQDPVAGFESGVGLYIDDVFLNRPQAGVLDIYDVERIEVLRGPQGTLYGRNTIGGAIKYVTRRLSDTPEVRARLELGNYDTVNFNLTGSTPITDTLRVGASVATFNRDGFGDNLFLGIDNYAQDLLGARASAEWEPTDNLFFRLVIDSIQDESDPRQGHRLTVSNVSQAPVLPDVFDTRAGLNTPIQDVDAKGLAFTAEWQVTDLIKLRNIFSTREDTTFSPIDFDALPTVDFDAPVIYDNEQTSNELQALFEGEGWGGVIGYFWMDADAFNAFDVVLGLTGDLIGVPGLNAYSEGAVNTDTWAIYGDFTFDLGEKFYASVGGRYTEDKRTARVLRQSKAGGFSPIFGGDAVPFATTSDFNGSETFDDFTPRLSLGWRPNDDHNVYVTYSEGFKGGFFDPRGQTTLAPDLDGDGVVSEDEVFEYMKVEPETVDSWELGWKGTLFGGRVSSAVAVFFADYNDVQIPGSIGIDTDGDGLEDTFAGVTTNAALAEINGVEWEGTAILADNIGSAGGELRFNWAIGYIDADFKEYIVDGEDVSDERVFQNTPEWTASGIITYNTPMALFGNEGDFSLITSYGWRDDHSQFETRNPFLDQEAYGLWNLSLNWQNESGNWLFGVHGRNITDEEYKVAGYFFPTLGLESTITAFYGNPAQYSVTAEYRWF